VHYYAPYLVQTALPSDYEHLLELQEEVLDLDLLAKCLEEELLVKPDDLSGFEATSASSPGNDSNLDS